MSVVLDLARAGSTARVRIVMLPPAYAAAGDFVRAGFVSAVRARGLAIDLVFADLEARHVTDASLTAQVWELIDATRLHGTRVWLGGISLGGYIALCAAQCDPGALAGLCLLAPYLGSHIVTSEVARAGLAAWKPAPLAADDDERRIWRFIQERPAGLPIHLGLGREDRFAERHRVLADSLLAAEVDTVPGGHDWPTWHRLWENFLDARFPRHE
jgi:pimeloyl-ACP methyl ester carboxylesterase